MSTALTGESTPSSLAQWGAVAGLIAAVLACYLPTPGDYWISYDNPQLIQLEPRTRALTLEGSARTQALINLATTPHHDLYQPLASLSWAIDHALFGWDRSGFHAHSIALHVLAVVVLFFLVLRLCGSVLAAFLAVLLCSVHPVMVQSVCWTISRTSSLAAIWILFGSHLYLSYARQPSKHHLLALSTLAFATSMMSKPVPSILLVPFMLDLWIRRPFSPRVWAEKLPLAAAVTAVTLANLQISNTLTGSGRIVRSWVDVLQKVPESLGLTIANVVWPRDLAVHYSYELGGSLIGWRWLAVAGAAAFVLSIGGALWRRGERGILLSAGAFLALLLPQIAAIRYRDVLTADRYVYIPLLFLAPGLAALLLSAFSDRSNASAGRYAIGLMLIAAAVLAVQTREESRTWGDEEQLWQRVVSQTPAPLPYLALCKLYGLEGRADEAVEACEQAYALSMKDPFASKDAAYAFYVATHARLAGDALKASTQPDAASRYYALASTRARQAIERWPDRMDLRYELGRTQLAVGDARGAIATFDALLAIEPDDRPSTTYLAAALFEVGDFERALELLERDLSAGMVEPIRNTLLAKIYNQQGRYDLAVQANLAWVMAEPDEQAAHDAFLATVSAAESTDKQEAVERFLELYRQMQADRSD